MYRRLALPGAIAIFASLGLTVACNDFSVSTQRSGAAPLSGFETNAGVTMLAADQVPSLVMGQVIYVPIYSEIYDLGPERPFQLTANLSLRNTDPTQAIVVEAVDYYDSAGNLIKAYLAQPMQLGPLTSTAVVVEQRDTTGGTGANFLVRWGASATVSPPVVEAVMISTASQQGVSFISPGRVISTLTAP